MCSYTQVVIVTHRSPVIPCQRLMFRSSQVIFLFFLFSFIQLVYFCHYCATLRCFDARVPRCHSQNFGEPLAIHLATVLVNLSQAELMRGLRCSVRVVWRIPLLADQRMHCVEVLLKAGIATVNALFFTALIYSLL